MADRAVDPLDGLLARLGYDFDDRRLADMAMCHRSWVAEHPGATSNERLEFLGDAVLGWIVADLVYRRYDLYAEGNLTDLRKGVVNSAALAEVAAELGVGPCLRLGRGEDAAGGRSKESILSDAFEAILGAVYLDGGADSAYRIVERLIGPRLVETDRRLDQIDEKSALQELAARRQVGPPEYDVRSTGPDHRRTYSASVRIEGRVVGTGSGGSKKAAERAAAREALAALDAGA